MRLPVGHAVTSPEPLHRSGEPRVLLVSGSTRAGSTNSALCRTAVMCPPPGVTVECYLDIGVLPQFNPDDDHDPLPPAVRTLRRALGSAAAVLFCTPEYAGTLPGSLKNMLDWTVGGTELTAKPVAWVNAAADRRRGEGAHATLATVLRYVQAELVHSACRHVPVTRDAIGPDGLITDPTTRGEISAVVQALLESAHSR